MGVSGSREYDEETFAQQSRDPILARYFKYLWDAENPVMIDMLNTDRLQFFGQWSIDNVFKRDVSQVVGPHNPVAQLCSSLKDPELKKECAFKVGIKHDLYDELRDAANRAKEDFDPPRVASPPRGIPRATPHGMPRSPPSKIPYWDDSVFDDMEQSRWESQQAAEEKMQREREQAWRERAERAEQARQERMRQEQTRREQTRREQTQQAPAAGEQVFQEVPGVDIGDGGPNVDIESPGCTDCCRIMAMFDKRCKNTTALSGMHWYEGEASKYDPGTMQSKVLSNCGRLMRKTSRCDRLYEVPMKKSMGKALGRED